MTSNACTRHDSNRSRVTVIRNMLRPDTLQNARKPAGWRCRPFSTIARMWQLAWLRTKLKTERWESRSMVPAGATMEPSGVANLLSRTTDRFIASVICVRFRFREEMPQRGAHRLRRWDFALKFSAMLLFEN